MGGSSFLRLLFFAVTAVLLVLGGFLLITARFSRRQGTTPYCRRCRYNLTSVNSSRCPECGADLTRPHASLVGERVVRRSRVATGVLLLAVGLIPLVLFAVVAANRTNWYTWLPASFVLEDLSGSDEKRSLRALDELRRRLKAGELAFPHAQRLADFCLAEQVAEPFRGIGLVAVETLGDLFGRQIFTPEQQTRFFEGLQQVRLSIRDRIACGQSVELRFDLSPRAPLSGPMFYGRVRRVTIDGRALYERFGGWQGAGSGGSGATWSQIQIDELGPHEVAAEVELSVGPGSMFGFSIGGVSGAPPADALYRTTRTLTRQVEVVAGPPEDEIKLIRTPELDAAVELCIQPSDIRIEAADEGASAAVQGWIARVGGARRRPSTRLTVDLRILRPPPIAFSFDVFALYGGQEFRLGDVQFRKGVMTQGSVGAEFALVGDAVIDLLLRPNPRGAAMTPDITEIWGGELRFPRLEVEVIVPRNEPHATTSPAGNP